MQKFEKKRIQCIYMVTQVEKVCSSAHPDPLKMKQAKKALQVSQRVHICLRGFLFHFS
jgi:hypothetical protein